MSEFLIKRFVKDYDRIDDSRVRESYGMLSSVVGIVCNVILFSVKFIIGALSHSISIVSDGFNNLSDCASCVVTMFGYKMAAKPADKDHPFGHGRIEYLTSLVIAMVIMVVGSQLFINSADKVIHPVEVEFSYVALTALLLSIVIKIWMGLFNRKLGNKIHSSVMLATSKDSINDVFATSATLIALVASIWTDAPLDGVMGVVVSVLILFSGFGIIRETVDQLLGQPADEELVRQLKDMVSECHVAKGMHDLIIHSYGPGNLIGSVHVEVDSRDDIMDIHDAIDELERNIQDELNVSITVHMDPIDFDDENVSSCKSMLMGIISDIDLSLSIHDFRIVAGPTHTNLIFDMVIPYECRLTEQFIREEVNRRLAERDITYYAVITFDKSYC